MKTYRCFEAFKHSDREAIIQYVMLVYGKDSALMAEEDIQQRKAIARDKTKVSTDLADEAISKLILQFLREQNNYKHSLLLTKQELYWETLEIMREPLTKTKDDDKRLKNIKLKGDVNALCDKLATEVDSLLVQIYTQEFKEEGKAIAMTFEQRLAGKR